MSDYVRRWRIDVASDMDSMTSIPEQASHWWELLHSESASSSDHREFGEWVARSPERVEAYLRTARLIKALKSRELQWPVTTEEVLICEAKASAEEPLRLPPGHSIPRANWKSDRKSRMPFAPAVAAALLIGIGSAWFLLPRPQQFKTTIGEQRSVLLEDGSRVTLNTASRIEVDLRKDQRLVRLVEGEVLFEVASDAARPFKVRTDNAVLSDLGTQFNVDVRPNRTTITVVEGSVAVEADGAGTRKSKELNREGPGATQGALVLAASDRIVITSSGPGVTKHGINVAAAIAWTQRQLIFEHQPLSEVVEEFNRYNRNEIEIDSIELRRREVTGVFQAKDPTSFLSFLSTIPGVQIKNRRDGTRIVTVDNETPNRKH
jgi:transmembrane sensor